MNFTCAIKCRACKARAADVSFIDGWCTLPPGWLVRATAPQYDEDTPDLEFMCSADCRDAVKLAQQIRADLGIERARFEREACVAYEAEAKAVAAIVAKYGADWREMSRIT